MCRRDVALCCTMLHYVAVSNLHMFDTVNTVAILDTYDSCSTVPRSKGCSMITMLYMQPESLETQSEF